MTTLYINDKEVTVPANTSILEACRMHGIDVPYFCYHPELKVAANCRMCLVEIEGWPKPAASCCTPVSEDMRVRTESETLKKDRKMVMEYLLIHHPLDCPVCDQGGSCKLQDYTVEHGASQGRYIEPKRRTEDKDMGPFITTCMTRCIHCTRCVRFADEIAGTGDMGVLNRGDHMRIDAIVEGTLRSELSGNLAELCPVGALLDKPSNDVSRPWELTRHHSVCTQCPHGCDIVIESRDDEVMRIKHDPNGAEAWICDRGRYVYDSFRSPDRLLAPARRVDGELRRCSWDDAIARSVELLKDKRVGIVFSPAWSLEGLTAIRLLHDAVMQDAKVAFDLHRRDARPFAFEEGLSMSTAEIEAADEVVILGSDLRQRLPILMQRLRRRVAQGRGLTRIGAMNYRTNTSPGKDALIRPRDWPAVIARAMQQMLDIGKGSPLMQAWMDKVPARHEAGKLLADALMAERCAVLVGEEIRGHEDAAALIYGIDLLMRAAGHGEEGRDGRNLIPEGMNAQVLSAVFGDIRTSVGELLRAAEAGELDALVLVGSDPLGDGLFPMQARRVLGQVPLVQVGAIGGQIARFADVQLPAAAYVEVEGTFVNMEGRVRIADKPLRSLGEERPLWKVMMRLADALGAEEVPAVSLEELRAHAVRFMPPLADVFAGSVAKDWRLPVARNKKAKFLPAGVEPVMDLDIVSRFSMYREGAWARASALLREAGQLFALPDVLVHPQTLRDLGLEEGECVIRTASGEITHHVGVREDVAQGVLFVAKRGGAGDLSSESVASLRGV